MSWFRLLLSCTEGEFACIHRILPREEQRFARHLDLPSCAPAYAHVTEGPVEIRGFHRVHTVCQPNRVEEPVLCICLQHGFQSSTRLVVITQSLHLRNIWNQ